jgi:class 3 adenylate cyclase
MGICAGKPVEEDHRLFGATVQLAARIWDTAAADPIPVAPVVRDLCLGKQFAFSDEGESTLKGFDEPLRLFEISWQAA